MRTKMFLWIFFILFIAVERYNGQINLYSDIDLSNLATQFQPANSIELLSSVSVATLADCGQLCNENVQCRTFDYDSHSLICRLFEGAVETGQIVSSGSLTSCVGSVRLESKFFAAFGQPCVQCTNSRYLVCSSSNNTCECPKDTFWDGVQCKNQGYEDANCSSNQCCRQDADFNCSNLHFCTAYDCGNMTIFKGDLPGNDLGSTNTPTFSMCCSQCQNYAGCMAFTWVSTPGTYFGMCYLKSSSGGSNTPFSDHISAYY